MGADQFFDRSGSVASALDWWREAGVDTLVSEEPRNWLAPPPAAPLATPVARTAPTAPVRPVAVPLPDTLDAFAAWRLGPDAPDGNWSGERMFAQGPIDAALMVVLEMPERDDFAAGQLLAGPVGKLFDRMLAAIGRDRKSVEIVPMCVARPASGRIPAEHESDLAAALVHYVALRVPQRLLIFGNAASRALIGADVAPSRGHLRGINQPGRNQSPPIHAQAVASFHPRFLLERPAAKPEAWKDLQLLIRGMTL